MSYKNSALFLRLWLRSVVDNANALMNHPSVRPVWAWCWTPVGAAGCVPSNWANFAQSETFATPTKAFTVTTAPQATVALGFAQVRILTVDIQTLNL